MIAENVDDVIMLVILFSCS